MMDKKLIVKKQDHKSNWRLVWGAIAFFSATFAVTVSILEAPAQAALATKPTITLDSSRNNFNKSLKLAQMGIRIPNNAPIPLNLRPRTHIPLPTDSRSSDDDYDSGYDRGYDDGYEHGYEHGYHRRAHRDREAWTESNRHRKDTVIIINPARSTYENYDNSDRDNNQRRYIRIIRNQVSF